VAPTWVFPFNRPAAPGPGDNQALAVNTTDGSVVYDVAFALVWADRDAVLNKNEAYAFASCTACRATAISFQVVLILGNAHVVVPQNISAAVNYDCLACVTQALAVQLVLSLPGAPSAAETADISALWREIQAFAGRLGGLSFAEIRSRLSGYEQRLADVVSRYTPAAGVSSGPVSSPALSPSGSLSAPGATDVTGSGVAGSSVAGSGVAGTGPASSSVAGTATSEASADPSGSPATSGSSVDVSSSPAPSDSGTPTSTP
jgi:putative peptide zinc metalloprotease protein